MHLYCRSVLCSRYMYVCDIHTCVNSPLNNTRSEQNKLIAATVRFCFVTRNATSTDRSRGVHTSITIIVNKYPINLCLICSSSNSNDLRKQSFCSNYNSRISSGWDEKRSAKNNIQTKAIDCVSIIVIARYRRIGALYYWLGFHHSTLFVICDDYLARDLYSDLAIIVSRCEAKSNDNPSKYRSANIYFYSCTRRYTRMHESNVAHLLLRFSQIFRRSVGKMLYVYFTVFFFAQTRDVTLALHFARNAR